MNWQDLSKLKRTCCHQNASSLNSLVRVFTNQRFLLGLCPHRPKWMICGDTDHGREERWFVKTQAMANFGKYWNSGCLNSCLVFGYTCLYETASARDSSGNPFCCRALWVGAKRLQRIARFEHLPVHGILQWEAGAKKAAKRIDTCGMIFFMACVEMITLFRIRICRN